MKFATAIALAALSPIVFAQAGPPPHGMGSGGAPMGSQAGGPGRSSGGSATASSETETIRILRMSAVQTDLALTASEETQLGSVARSLQSVVATEDTALAAVSKVLTTDQANRLRELLVQDLGYNSLALADVRAQLSLTAEQTTQVTSLVSTLETAKAALATSTNVATATKAKTTLMSKTATDLAKVLTEDQDKRLRALAGRALGTKTSQ